MKMKLMLAAAIAAVACSANAASYYVNNVVAGGSSDVLIENAGGALLDGGVVAIGFFTGGAPSSSLGDIATTIANFQLQHSVIAGSPSVDLEGSFPGYYQSSIINNTVFPLGDPRIGQGMYLFAGNATTLAASTQFALVRIATIASDDPFPQQYTADAAAAVNNPSSIVIGVLDTAANPLGGTSNTLQLVPIPEPSIALLGVLGVFGLIRRRR